MILVNEGMIEVTVYEGAALPLKWFYVTIVKF